MFRGTHTTRLDEKGRLKVPAEFKRLIDENYGMQFYITSRTGTVAEVYPMQEWEEIERRLAAAPDSNPVKKKFLKHTNYYGQVVDMDGQGRLLLPAALRDKANLRGEVAVMGSLKHLLVRNAEELRKEIAAEPFTDEDDASLSTLGV
jgi:transcriptional regulator MraZ